MGSCRLLVVYKKSQLELYREHDRESLDGLRENEPDLMNRFEQAHQDNSAAIQSIRNTIASLGIEASFQYRAEHERDADYDLVISVGGDGTLLDVSHSVGNTPLLGINSSPTMSVGHFCATDADGFGTLLEDWLAGNVTPKKVNRLQIEVNGKALSIPVLNDILYAHTVPGAVSRYVLRVGDIEEEHKSSGIWISTAAGSTAAIQSAGGRQMHITDTQIQFVVREPYTMAGAKQYECTGAMTTSPIELLSKMRTAALYIDGHRRQVQLSLGDRVIIQPHPNPLKLVGYQGNEH